VEITLVNFLVIQELVTLVTTPFLMLKHVHVGNQNLKKKEKVAWMQFQLAIIHARKNFLVEFILAQRNVMWMIVVIAWN
jgi:hypothetical protein